MREDRTVQEVFERFKPQIIVALMKRPWFNLGYTEADFEPLPASPFMEDAPLTVPLRRVLFERVILRHSDLPGMRAIQVTHNGIVLHTTPFHYAADTEMEGGDGN